MLFSRKEVTPEPTVTGTDVLKGAVRSRRYKGHLGKLARDITGTTIADLEAFVDHGKPLPELVLQGLAKEFFNAAIDSETGLLRSLNRTEQRALCTAYPQAFDPTSSPYYFPHDPDAPRFNLKPDKPEPIKPKGRPGWLGGF